MSRLQKISDFCLTGCALVPALALYAAGPELALFLHIVLLFTGIGVAACEQDAPFKNVRSTPKYTPIALPALIPALSDRASWRQR